MSLGVVFGISAFCLFGIVPVYYKSLDNVPAVQIALHRFTWTFPETMLLVLVCGQTKSFYKQAFTKSNFLLYAGSGMSMGASTVLLIWAVNSGYLLEVSLGAFLNPVTMVVVGVGLLKEKLRRWQVVSVALATIGVGIFAVAYGKFPWVAILLTIGDGIYSLFKKKAPLTPLHGLALESGIMFPFCLAGTIILESQGLGVFSHGLLQTDLLLVGTGIMTIIPVLLLVAAMQITPLYVMGLMSNLTPTIQFILGVAVYHEPFSMTRLTGFLFLWVSMAVFGLDSYWAYKESLADKHKGIATPHSDEYTVDVENGGFDNMDGKVRTFSLVESPAITK
ncbi:protein RarD [Aphanomyces astaci]|uniref:Protein RarD n=1 Tax=Aphanomyces astaci TaxID=112090 RepID=W4H4D5_APHAT|nr:protein RarD [Aphanomyces astaci]ETV86875.1 protein RarD [Aphanomyces astaci]RHY10100.1 hypothetical protein DYB36_008366 [Aphanomyces astaci]RHY36047.1 hypothetical protein DYB25_014295 [Aphanomyces astaci]RHY41036.1 hypothetical protein DYB34_007453 [Aphanomyces astaci]RHY67349.1 hypothetical protein DYB30_007516 [Aphanomyces astaci]|eukprot:XP_009823674.1 protein RarD [Aphanomyces astaci]